MNVFKNDKFVLVKEFGKLNNVGSTYEVASILEKSIVMRDGKTKVAACAVDIENFDEYFKKAEDINGWTPWTKFSGAQGEVIGFYRTNMKKVQVKSISGVGIKAEACCYKDDKFDLYFGLNLAFLRCKLKALNRMKKSYTDCLEEIEPFIDETSNQIQQMYKVINKEKNR